MKKIFLSLILLSGYLFSFEYNKNYFLTKEASVIDVIDGDTIKINYQGKFEKIRLSFVDTMESKKNKKAKKDFYETKENVSFKELIEYGKKAKYFLKKELPYGTKIILYIPKDKPKDSFKRFLAIVKRKKDNVVINELLLINGLAKTYYLKDAPDEVKDYYLELEKKSQEKNIGIWKILKKK